MNNITLYTYALDIPDPLPDGYTEAYEWTDTHLTEFIINKNDLDKIAVDLFGEEYGYEFEESYAYDASLKVYEEAKEKGWIISERIVKG